MTMFPTSRTLFLALLGVAQHCSFVGGRDLQRWKYASLPNGMSQHWDVTFHADHTEMSLVLQARRRPRVIGLNLGGHLDQMTPIRLRGGGQFNRMDHDGRPLGDGTPTRMSSLRENTGRKMYGDNEELSEQSKGDEASDFNQPIKTVEEATRLWKKCQENMEEESREFDEIIRHGDWLEGEMETRMAKMQASLQELEQDDAELETQLNNFEQERQECDALRLEAEKGLRDMQATMSEMKQALEEHEREEQEEDEDEDDGYENNDTYEEQDWPAQMQLENEHIQSDDMLDETPVGPSRVLR